MNINAKKWIECLRSGKFEQGRYYLHNNDRFCCIGVACEIFKEELDINLTPIYKETTTITLYNGKQSIFPPEVEKHLGLKDQLDKPNDLGYLEIMDTLIYLNDALGYTFDEIADYIEVHQNELFEN